MNRNLLILGAGGHGRVVEETARTMGTFSEIDFLDDVSESAIGICEDNKKYMKNYTYAFVAIGNNHLRKKWQDIVKESGYRLAILVHPTAYVSSSANIEEGTIIGARAVVNVNAVIKQGCIVGIGALVDHDSIIGEYSYINAGAVVKAGCEVEKLIKVDVGEVRG